jgi:small subunit ribosomal protein S2
MRLPEINIKYLLESGVHFGHTASRWNPKMAPYIYGVSDKLHVINLNYTTSFLKVALKKIYEVAKSGGKILFVGTKLQASESIAEYAQKCGQFYVNHRWLGGMLTNWSTVKDSIKALENIEKLFADQEKKDMYTKKELLDKSRQMEKLQKLLNGIRNINGKPDLIVVIDTNKEHIAIKEARKLGISTIAVVDTNCDPDEVDIAVPGNDDSIKAIKAFLWYFAEAGLMGIEDALVESGVDIGESEIDINTATKKVVQITKSSNKKATAISEIEYVVNVEFLKDSNEEIEVASLEKLTTEEKPKKSSVKTTKEEKSASDNDSVKTQSVTAKTKKIKTEN